MRRQLPFLLAFLLVLSFAPAAAARDYSDGAYNIIPSSQYGSVPPPPQADDQALMYDALTPLFDNVKRRDLSRHFKSERLGTRGQGPLRTERVPRKGVRLVRDRFNVPHIYGKTNDDVTWGAGWALAEDRELLLEQARYNARVAAIDLPGTSAISLIVGLKQFQPSRQTERELAKQVGLVRRYGARGRQLLHDVDVFVTGINAYFKAKKKTYKPWTRNDVFALNAVKSELFGEGGGNEVRSAQFLDGLQDGLGQVKGESVWNDLRQRQDPETPVTVKGRFPYAPLPAKRSGNVVLDNGSFKAIEPGGAAVARAAAEPRQASNILMVAGRRSRSGHPLFVGGPQIGYFYPGLTLEMDLHGPGWSARGATSAPFPGYILIGRREDFVWTLTSAGADIVDSYVETLCGGSDTKYLYKGRCRNMTNFDAGVLSGTPVSFKRTVHGPVVGYGTVNGRRVAVSRKRSSYLRDAIDLLLFQRLTRGKIGSAREFFKAAAVSPQTFNTFYADDREAAMITTGRLPTRAKGVDSGLPTDGRGRHEWRGFLPAKDHPQGIIRSGVMNNWNNKPARGFPGGDNQYAYGSIQRVDLLNRNTAKRRRHTLATLTGAMNAAATQDVRAVMLQPVLSAVLRGGPAPSARATRSLELLEDWRAKGGSRLDRDLDGKIDHPGAAVMDRAWPGLADAAMRPQLGPQLLTPLDEGFMRRYDQPPGGQFGGWHTYMHKDLRTLLGRKVRGKFRNRYCGAGDLARCRSDLWAALDAAGAQLEAEQGPNLDAWRADASAERI
ncbi:MAG TPA: penicillin acylase family protein, partial [Thermoleophilaceae bacterium]|nr:penicillin acylase family protein [Thermoleophilaceae bacterium]